MSKVVITFAALAVVASVAGCAKKPAEEEFVVVQPEPISVEPTYTGKYK
ncbi:hypothetical protein [Donghicola sp. XS_ASV15]